MIVRCRLISVLTIVLTLWAHPGSTKGERWSRQVSNSDWIPLANPRSLENGEGGNSAQLRSFGLPPPLQQQYQQQLLQLQETQESIQKLLLLQQQLRAQQQLLQAQSYNPEGFSTDENRKSALHQSVIANVQTLPQLVPAALLPPPPGDRPQPPEFPAQDFLDGNQQETGNFGYQDELPRNDNAGEEKTRDHISRQGGHYKNHGQQQSHNQNGEQNAQRVVPGPQDPQNEAEEEVQLLYVPAETLAQRDNQQKAQRVRNRKQYSSQQQLNNYQQNRGYQKQQQQVEEPANQGLEGSRPSSAQQTYARQVLYQIEQEQTEQNRFQKEEREKELARLNEEQKELERQAKLHEELVAREEEAQRQKEEEVRRELERQEEEARQRELQRLREAKRRKELEELEEAERKKEAERREELERQKIAEIRAKEAEARQAEIDRLAALERQKEHEIQLALEQQREIERQQAEEESKARADLEARREALAREEKRKIDRAENYRVHQHRQQHLTETTIPKNARLQGVKQQTPRDREGEKRSGNPSPNQPPLSVYMGSSSPVVSPQDLKVSDVLAILKDAKTISVLDTVGPNSPQVFVGPTNLDPPSGYAKFDLPYLSAIDNNRVERKVDKLPFFVAPLSFKPPPGYAKIPFPAPHVGSVVVNTLENAIDQTEGAKPFPTPLFNPQETVVATSTPRYEQSILGDSSDSPPSGTRYRHRQFYNNNNYERLPPRPRISPPQFNEDRESKTREFLPGSRVLGNGSPTYESLTTPLPTPVNYEDGNGGQNAGQGLAFINRELGEHFNPPDIAEGGQDAVNGGESDLHPSLGTPSHVIAETPQGPTQYSLPAELPRVSPQLPGLVNSLLEENEFGAFNTASPPLTTTSPSTTTTTSTTETPVTTTATYRTRGRQRGRIVPTRTPATTTTTTTTTRSNAAYSDRQRRPYSRSRVRQGYATTTQTYQETHYDPTKSRASAGNEDNRHSISPVESHRRPTLRNQRYRGRGGGDRNAVQPETRPEAGPTENPAAIQADQEASNFGIGTPKPSLRGPDGSVQENAAFHQSSTAAIHEERPDAQPLQGVALRTSEAPAFEEGLSTIQEIQGLNFHSGFKSSSFGEPNFDQNPVNGFDYRAHQGQNVLHGVSEAPLPTQQHNLEGFDDFHQPKHPDELKITRGFDQPTQIPPVNQNSNGFQGPESNHEEVVDPQQPLRENFEFNDATTTTTGRTLNENDFPASTEVSIDEVLTEVTTPRSAAPTPPVVIRQRLTTRLNRPHVDSVIQTRPTGSRDEFVRFRVANQDRQEQKHGFRTQNQPRSRLRTRNRAQIAQPENNEEYVRIQRPASTTTTTTSTTTQSPRTFEPKEQDPEIEYGFIRPPSFKPIHPVGDKIGPNVAPIYKPKYEQVQSEDSTNDSPIEVSTPAPQTFKNRQKYQLPNRRPLTRSTTTTTPSPYTATTAQRQEDLEVKSRPRNEEWNQPSRIRGRTRRPGKKRTTTTSTTTTTTTTTTESVLDSNNELPLDENYPQIIQGLPAIQQPSSTPKTTNEQGLRRTLYDEELESPDLATFSHNQPTQEPPQLHAFDQGDNLEFPRPDFVLNFGVGSDHEERNEEYDQTQLASTPHRKYNLLNRGAPIADVEGAESQWSTKLTLSSFQPSSLPNHVDLGGKNGAHQRREKSDESFDIITAAPGHSDIVVNASYLGNAKKSGTDSQERREPPVLQGRNFFEMKNDTTEDKAGDSNDPSQSWNNGRDQGLREFFAGSFEAEKERETEKTARNSTSIDLSVTQVPDAAEADSEETNKSFEDAEEANATTTKRTVNRRRRVRVRVRPAEDFVSAESQHVGSAWNYLLDEKSGYLDKRGRLGEKGANKTPATTTTSEFKSGKSFLEEIFDGMRKNSDSEAAPVDFGPPEKLSDDFTTTTTTAAVPREPETDPREKLSAEKKSENQNGDEAIEKRKPSVEFHRFRPKQSAKSRLTFKTDDEEGVKVTTTEIGELETSTSAHDGLSDFMSDFLKSLEAQEEESTTETTTTLQPKTEEDNAEVFPLSENTGVTILPTEVTTAVEIGVEEAEAEEMGGSIAEEKVEETTRSSGPEIGENVGPQTTPEATLSPEEFATTTTTTEIPIVGRTTSIYGNATTQDQSSKVLRTSTTTEISHMTEICYRGRCVKTKSKKEVRRR